MTGEEMERAIEFILQNQATLDEQVKQVNARIEQVNDNLSAQIARVTESVAETNRVVQLQATSQSRINEMLTQAVTNLAETQAKTEGKVDRLAGIVERLVERLG